VSKADFGVSNWGVTTGTCKISTPSFPVLLNASTEAEFREQFEKVMTEKFAPKLNKMQTWLYGNRVYSLTREQIKDIVENGRGMGNTTAQALQDILQAIKTPNKPVYLLHDHGANSSAFQRQEYRRVVQNLIDKLEFKFMVIREHNQTLTFEV
jgi:hypothetical protein